MSMIPLHLVIDGQPVTKKNSMQIVTINGRPRIIPSKTYRQYEKVFLPQVPAKAKQNIAMPITLKCSYYMPTRRRCDLCNLLEATQDLLVKAGVIEDDNANVIYSVDGSRVYYDKENPRVEIELIPKGVSMDGQEY